MIFKRTPADAARPFLPFSISPASILTSVSSALACLALVAAMSSATAERDAARSRPAADGGVAAKREASPPPVVIGWLPEWLSTPINRAIADATDTRPRR